MPTETVLITGASSGIGLELARCFARDGSELILVARREELLRELADQLTAEFGCAVRVLPADLAQTAEIERLHQGLAADGVEVDVLVNNAGFGMRGEFCELDLGRQLDVVRVNILALTHLTRLFLPGMAARNRGGVLNVGSIAAFQAGPRMAVYYATKAYVLSFSEAIREELIQTNVHVTCLCPGPTRTEFGDVAEMTDALLFQLGPMSGGAVAKIGHRAFRRGRTIAIAGVGNKLTANISRLVPRWLSRKVSKRLQ